jgi:FdhE protein
VSSSLDLLVKRHPEMDEAGATLHALATALPDPHLPAGIPHLEAARSRLMSGVPALEGEPLLSGADLAAQLEILTSILKIPNPTHGGLYPADLEGLAQAARTGAWEWVAAAAQPIECEADLLVTLVDHAARPALRAGARAVHPVILECRWPRGVCPACGSAPLLGELRGGSSGTSEPERVLRCGRCLTAWAFPRLRCTACAESNHERLAYLHGSDEGAYRRAEVCHTCRTYLKSVAVLAPLTCEDLLVVDLTSAALDVAAVERGFHR